MFLGCNLMHLGSPENGGVGSLATKLGDSWTERTLSIILERVHWNGSEGLGGCLDLPRTFVKNWWPISAVGLRRGLRLHYFAAELSTTV